MIALLVVLACAGLNRVRGLTFDFMPGRNLYFVAPLVGALAWLAGSSPAIAAAWAIAFLLWASAPWGRWFDLGHLPVGYGRHEPDLFERTVERLSFGSDHVAMLWRHAYVVPLLVYLAGWPALAFPVAVLAAYAIAWAVLPRNPIWLAELIVGATWGALLVL